MATARTIDKSAPLSSDFGLNYAVHLFGQEAIDSLPVYERGPNKGKPKGSINWRRTTTAGYHVNAGTGVKEGTTIRAWISEHKHGGFEDSAAFGKWLGRTQNLCASMCYLGQENRDREMARQARIEEENRKEIAQLRAEMGVI